MQFSCEQHLATAKRLRENAYWLEQQQRIEAVKRSNTFLILAVKAARRRGSIDISSFDFDALNPDWKVIDAQVDALEPINAPPDAQDGPNPNVELDQGAGVLQLIKTSMESPTPQGIADFLDFTTKFRRLSVWNARMAYIQRPGARVLATEPEWARNWACGRP